MVAAIELDDAFHGVLLAAAGNDELVPSELMTSSDRLPGRAELLSPASVPQSLILDAICSRRPRKDVPLAVLGDRVLFETACTCGARAPEVCGMYVEDLDLRPDDEHARVHGKGGTVRTVRRRKRASVRSERQHRRGRPEARAVR